VELYKHRNPTTEAEWICIRCADQLQISDNFRKTAQSDTSIKKMFRREYGPTVNIAVTKPSEKIKDRSTAIDKKKPSLEGFFICYELALE